MSIGPTSAAAMAGPITLRDDVPHPKLYFSPGSSNVGSVSSRHPPTSIKVVGPPMWVTRTLVISRAVDAPAQSVRTAWPTAQSTA